VSRRAPLKSDGDLPKVCYTEAVEPSHRAHVKGLNTKLGSFQLVPFGMDRSPSGELALFLQVPAADPWVPSCHPDLTLIPVPRKLDILRNE